jgi:putative ABC transport system permease protein
MDTLLKDLKYGVRMLIKRPLFAVVTLSILALGIGANTGIFSIVNAVLIRPLPFKDSDSIVALWEHKANIGQGRKFRPAIMEYREWEEQATSFASMAGFRVTGYAMTGNGDPEQVKGMSASPGYFDLLGVPALYGKTFSKEDLEGPPAVVLSYRLWRRKFGASPSIIGKPIMLNLKSYYIIGVMPPGFEFQDKDAELWTMITPTDDYFSTYQGMHIVQTIARLRPGVDARAAESEMNVIQQGVDRKFPDGVVGSRISVTRLQDDLSGGVRPVLLLLLGVVAFVLLIACANVASLLLGRASERRKEIAVRTALGAARGRLVRQMLTESMLIFVLGGALGLGLAYIGLRMFLASNPFGLPRVDQISIDPIVLTFTVGLSLLTGLIFGLIPAIQAPRLNVSDLLKEDARGTSSGIRSRLARNLLVVVEVSMSLMLLVGAGLMMATLKRLGSVPIGIAADGLLTLRVEMGKVRYPEPGQRIQFVDQTIQNVATLPGVQSSAFTSNLPLQGVLTDRISIEGRPAPAAADIILVGKEAVTPDFFRTLSGSLIRGRELSDKDIENNEFVTVINEEMVKQLFPDEDPIGKRIKHGELDYPFPWMTVVGVVGNVRQLGLEDQTTPVMYVPYRQVIGEYTDVLARNMYLVVKTSIKPDSLYPAIRDSIWSLDRDMPISDVKSMNGLIGETIQQPRMRALLVTIFAGFAVLIAAVGLYGVISQSVLQRTHELGIRMALGAGSSHIRLMVLKEGMTLALIGIVLGAGGALVLSRAVASLLFGVSAQDPGTFVTVSLILLVVATVASYLPARRATRIDPLAALRTG